MTKRPLLLAGGVIAGVVVVVIVALPMLLDANQFRPSLESNLSSALGRTVTIGHLKVAILSGGISVDDISVADDPAFSATPFLTAKSVTMGVDLMPLIFSRQVHVRSLELEQPQVALRRSASGQWNFSSMGTTSAHAGPASSAAGAAASVANISVQRLAMTGGRVIVFGPPASHGKSRVYEDVTLEATGLSYASQFPFRVNAKTPGDGTVSLNGTIGPLNATDVSQTPFHATLAVTHLDMASTGFSDPGSGLAGVVDVTSDLVSDGHRMTSHGKLNADKLQLVQGGSPARVPVEIDYGSDYDLKTQRGVVTQGDMHIGKALAQLTGDYSTSGEATTVRMKLTGRKMPVPELEAMLPALGVTMPAGASLQAGTLDTDLAIAGPVDHLVTSGPIDLSNARIKGFDLSSKMRAIAALAGLPGSADTIIQTLSTTLRIAPDGTRAESLNLVVPAIGSLAGNGTVAPGGGLDFKMLAKLSDSNPLARGVSRYTSLGQPQNGIPFTIAGTTANPVFAPDVAGVVSGAVSNIVKDPNAATTLGGLLGGLFGKKK